VGLATLEVAATSAGLVDREGGAATAAPFATGFATQIEGTRGTRDETASPVHQKSADLREVDGNQITRITARNALQNRCTTTVLTRRRAAFTIR